VLKDAKLTQRDEATAILCCLQDSLREPPIMHSLVQFHVGNGRTEEHETAESSRTVAAPRSAGAHE
jgi:hypothetical protein